jgi:hypothetical protein
MIGRVFVRASDHTAWVCVAKLADIVILKKSGAESEYEKFKLSHFEVLFFEMEGGKL